MKHTPFTTLFVLTLLIPQTSPAEPPTTDSPGFAGKWETTFGEMTLTQQGDRVVGTYQMSDGVGRIEGTVDGNRLTFTYTEPDASGEGWFKLAPNGWRFTGRWRPRGEQDWKTWKGARIDPDATATPTSTNPDATTAATPAGVDGFVGLWDTDFGRLRLVRDADTIRGIYELTAGSSLTGRIEGSKLVFTYREPDAHGEGWFELAPNGRRFSGKWRPAGDKDWSVWNGDRVESEPGVRWLVVIESRWENSLSQPEFTFGAMLRAFFAKSAQVRVRTRFFHDEDDLGQHLSAAAFLAEPTVVVVASHGKARGVVVGDLTIGSDVFARSLRYAPNVRLLHFSACRMMKGGFCDNLFAAIPAESRFPVSGYTTAVDWSVSALADFLYLDLILDRGLDAGQAREELIHLMPIAGGSSSTDAGGANGGSANGSGDISTIGLKPAGFRLRQPPTP